MGDTCNDRDILVASQRIPGSGDGRYRLIPAVLGQGSIPVPAGCRHGYVKNYDIMVNSIYNAWRWEDVWLDR